MVAGSKTARRSDMANIGSFKKVGSDFQGEIVTLSVQTKGVRIVARDQPLQRQRSQPPRLCGPGRDRGRLVEALQRGPRLSLAQARRSVASTRRSSPTCSMTRTARATPSSGRAPASATATEPARLQSPARPRRAGLSCGGPPAAPPTHKSDFPELHVRPFTETAGRSTPNQSLATPQPPTPADAQFQAIYRVAAT